MSGFFPYPTSDTQLSDFEVYYTIDSIVHPEHRGAFLFPLLVKTQCRYFRNFGKKMFLWGIENSPGSLEFLPRLLEREGFSASLSATTKLTEIYVSNYPPERLEGKFSQSLLSSLSDASIQTQVFKSVKSKSNKFLLPTFGMDFFQRIIGMDPQAKFFSVDLENGNSAACFSWNFSSVRKFRSRRQVLVLQAKKSRLGLDPKLGDEIPVLALSCISFSSLNALRILLDRIYDHAYYASIDILVAHGIPDGALSRFLQFLTIESKLRVFMASSIENSVLLNRYQSILLDLDVGCL